MADSGHLGAPAEKRGGLEQVSLLARLNEGCHAIEQLLDAEGLLQDVGGALLHGEHRIRHGGVRRHHDDIAAGHRATNALQEVEAVAVRENLIADGDVETTLAECELRARAARRGGDGVTRAAQSLAQHAQDLFVVVDQQNFDRGWFDHLPAERETVTHGTSPDKRIVGEEIVTCS